jgi:hypothetical protein
MSDCYRRGKIFPSKGARRPGSSLDRMESQLPFWGLIAGCNTNPQADEECACSAREHVRDGRNAPKALAHGEANKATHRHQTGNR